MSEEPKTTLPHFLTVTSNVTPRVNYDKGDDLNLVIINILLLHSNIPIVPKGVGFVVVVIVW